MKKIKKIIKKVKDKEEKSFQEKTQAKIKKK